MQPDPARILQGKALLGCKLQEIQPDCSQTLCALCRKERCRGKALFLVIPGTEAAVCVHRAGSLPSSHRLQAAAGADRVASDALLAASQAFYQAHAGIQGGCIHPPVTGLRCKPTHWVAYGPSGLDCR